MTSRVRWLPPPFPYMRLRSPAALALRSPPRLRSRRRPSPDPRSASSPAVRRRRRPRGTCGLALRDAALAQVRRKGINSDLAFFGHYAIQGNFNGFQVWDISNPRIRRCGRRTSARRRRATCRSTRISCSFPPRRRPAASTAATQGIKDTVSAERIRGVRIFDISDIAHPQVHRQRADVPRIAHAHAARRSEGPGERLRLHLRLVGVRSPTELAGLHQQHAGEGSELGALPHRSDQGSARASGAGGDRELAAHLRRSRGAGARTARPTRRRHRGAMSRREGTRRVTWSASSA